MYHSVPHSGSTPDFWEENWAASQFEESLRFMAADPLRPIFEKYLHTDSLVLEGGCGMGNYAAYYASRGFNVIGLDFALQALRTLHIRQPHLKLCGGDVANLPFADETFDLYYSGGVVEHFESGAGPSLLEASRVLKDSGALLISVPYYNPLRRALKRFRGMDWRSVDRCEVEPEDVMPGKSFFQYAYRPPEFQRMLESSGLNIVEKTGYAVIWGLSELPFARGTDREFPAHADKVTSDEPVAVDVNGMIVERKPSLIRRLVINEDASVPVLGLGVKLMRWSVANMMMFVCKKV